MTESNSVKKNGRNMTIDIARGIAMICIVMGHVGNATINRIVFTFHVPIFFLITGFFFREDIKLGELIKEKAKRILVPYAITCIVIIVLGTIQGYFNGNAMGTAKDWIIASLYGAGGALGPFYIKGIGAIWFLWATFWGLIILRLAFFVPKWLRPFIIGGAFAFGYFTRFYWLPLSVQPGACAAFYMYCGWLFGKCRGRLTILGKTPRIIIGVVAFAVWIQFIIQFKSFWLVQCDIGRGVVDLFGSLCACASVFILSHFIERYWFYLSAFLSYIGKYSIVMLCVHLVELNLFQWWILVLGLSDKPTAQLVAILAMKLTFDIGMTVFLSYSEVAMRSFGLKANKVRAGVV